MTTEEIQAVVARAKGLLFDLDGTLIDSSGSTRRAWSAFAERNGLEIDDVLAYIQGKPSEESTRELTPEGKDPVEEHRLVEDAEVSDAEGIIPHAGALAALTSGKKTAIVTSCSDELAAVRLGASGLPQPEVMITASKITKGKPDPEPFLLGAKELGVAPGDCIVFEDAPAGIKSGKAAGAFVVALRTTHSDDTLVEADVIVDDLSVVFG